MRSQTFFKHAIVYGAGSMLLQAAGFILLPIYTRYLSPSAFGMLEVSARMGEVVTICLMLPGIRVASHAFYKQVEDDQERRRVVSSALILVFAVAAAATCILMLTAGPLAHAVGITSPSILRLAFLVVMFEAIATIPLVIAQARLESGFYVGTTFFQFLIKVSLGILFVVGFQWGIWGVLLASVLTSATFAIGLTVREFSKGLARPSGAMLREMLRFGSPFIAGGLGYFLLHDGDRFFILHYSGEAAVGVYAFGYKIARLVSLFSREPLQTVWAAHMYDVAKEPEAPAVFGRAFSRIMGVYVMVGLALCLLQDEVTGLLGGRAYAAATRLLAPIVLAYAFLAAAEIMDSGFYVRRKTHVKFWITLASTSIMLALYAVLIPKFGIEGAAFATLLGFLFNAWLTWKVSQRAFPVAYEFKRLVGMLGLAALYWGISRLLPISYWMVPAKVGLWLLWVATLWSFGIISVDEKVWISGNVNNLIARVSQLFPSRRFRRVVVANQECPEI